MVWTDKVNQVLLTEQVDLLVSSQRLLAGEWHVKPASTGHVHLNKQQTHDKSLHPFQKTKQHISAWSNTNTRQKLTPKMTDPVSLNKQHMTKVCTSEAQALLSWANNTWQKPASQKHKLCYPEQTRRENSQHLTNTGLVIPNKQHVKTASISQTLALLSWTNKTWKQPAPQKHKPSYSEQTTNPWQEPVPTSIGCVQPSKQQSSPTCYQCALTTETSWSSFSVVWPVIFIFSPLAHIDFLSVFYCQRPFSWFTLPDAMTAKCRSHKTLFVPPVIGCYSCTTHTLGLCRQTDRETGGQRTVLTWGMWPKTSRLEGAGAVVRPHQHRQRTMLTWMMQSKTSR